LVFVKPDVVVIYDRVELGPDAGESRWIAATGPELTVDGSGFRIGSGAEFLHGRALLPEGSVVSSPEVLGPGWQWKDQKLLEVRPAEQGKAMEYLVVMRVGGEDAPLAAPDMIRDDDEVGVRVRSGDRSIEVRFNRDGACGGEAVVAEGGTSARYELRAGIADSYWGWRADTRYQKWMREPRFGFVILQPDGGE